MIFSAESESYDAPEKHLNPAHDRQCFPYHAVCENYVAPYASMDAFLEVEFEVYAEYDLSDEHEHEDRGEGSVNVRRELATAVAVAQKVAHYCEYGTKGLKGDMPSGADDLEIVRLGIDGEDTTDVPRGPCQWGILCQRQGSEWRCEPIMSSPGGILDQKAVKGSRSYTIGSGETASPSGILSSWCS